jgi:hypothetical protein
MLVSLASLCHDINNSLRRAVSATCQKGVSNLSDWQSFCSTNTSMSNVLLLVLPPVNWEKCDSSSVVALTEDQPGIYRNQTKNGTVD